MIVFERAPLICYETNEVAMSEGKSKGYYEGGIVRTAQMIVAALVVGVLVFAGVVYFMNMGGQPPQGQPMISMIMAALGATVIVARFFIPGLVVQSSCRGIADGTWKPAASNQPGYLPPSNEREKLLSVYLSKTIIGAALLEGGAFANLVAYLLEGQWYSLIFGIALALAIAAGMPTKTGVESWVDRQLRQVEEIRSMPRK
jgi:peptidoglycan/LPS O-acetylase OafA/YrhL